MTKSLLIALMTGGLVMGATTSITHAQEEITKEAEAPYYSGSQKGEIDDLGTRNQGEKKINYSTNKKEVKNRYIDSSKIEVRKEKLIMD